jgi:hypothetical protein
MGSKKKKGSIKGNNFSCVSAGLELKCINIKQIAIISSPTLLTNPKL